MRITKVYGFSIRQSKLSSSWAESLSNLSNLFCLHLRTENRINSSDPAPALNVLEQPVSHPIHMLFKSDKLEKKICGYFRQAFGIDLTVYRLGGAQFPLLVGDHPSLCAGEDRISESYCRRLLDSTVPLQEQGDGMRSFTSVVLHLLAVVTPSILLLDEPEAFLHPPQAKLLGELIAEKRRSQAQLFVATHSADVLNGLLKAAPGHLRLLRIRREGGINRVTELDKNRAKAISSDPVMSFSSVMSGVFHERVIICESESDCMFYGSLLDLPEVRGEQKPDVLFVHANGKHRIAALAKALVELDVPVDVIVDLDVLRSAEVLRSIVDTLGRDWSDVAKKLAIIQQSVEAKKPERNAPALKKEIANVLDSVTTEGEFPTEAGEKIKRVLKSASSWNAVKGAGESAFPKGQTTQAFQQLRSILKKRGVWLVSVGELEGFCKSVGGHGPAWVQEVISTHDLATSAELEEARDFMREIWSSRTPM